MSPEKSSKSAADVDDAIVGLLMLGFLCLVSAAGLAAGLAAALAVAGALLTAGALLLIRAVQRRVRR